VRLNLDLGVRPSAAGLSIEEALLESAVSGGEEIVRLWIGDRAIVLGRSQYVDDEVDRAATERLGLPILRRVSGGGTVLHYPGNLNVAAVVRSVRGFSSVDETFRRFGEAVTRGIRSLGVRLEVEGNALLVEGRKVSGAAQARRSGVVLYHCTLLVAPGWIAMGSVLRAGRDDYHPMGVGSRHRPTTTLAEVLRSEIAVGAAAEAVVAGLGSLFDEPWTLCDPAPAEDLRAAELLKGKYSRASWNLQR
jgi:lipoate-protein ligase A